MKYLLITASILLTSNAQAQVECRVKPCKTTFKAVVHESADDVNTPTPEELEGATYIVKTKDGKEHRMSAKTFKVVKRQQQYKNKEKIIVEKVVCEPKIIKQVVTNTVVRTIVKKAPVRKNLVMVGGRYDYTDVEGTTNGTTATIQAKRGVILDISYMRQNLFDSRFGAGVGIDTNGTPRVFGGIEF